MSRARRPRTAPTYLISGSRIPWDSSASATIASMVRLLIGFAWSMVLGVLVGLLMGLSRWPRSCWTSGSRSARRSRACAGSSTRGWNHETPKGTAWFGKVHDTVLNQKNEAVLRIKRSYLMKALP